MRTIPFTSSLLTVGLMATASLAVAQNINQAAVDTMTKDVAKVVFASIKQPKAQEIYVQLLNCGDGCDPQAIIRMVGGWDAVGAKMQELNELKNTQAFQNMSPTEANTAIHRQLAQFYVRYKKDNNYARPLNPAVQQQILAKVDQLLPPGAGVDPAPVQRSLDNPTETPTITGDEAVVDPATFQLSKLEREVKERQQKQLWMMILSGIVGLLVGASAIYLLLYRAAQAEIQALLDKNNQLQNSLETAQRTNSGSGTDMNSIRVDYRQKANAYDAVVKELGSNPLVAIRQLKQQTTATENPGPAPVVRSGEPKVESGRNTELMPEPIPTPVMPAPVPAPPPVPAPARSEVFYFPPPDQNGQFDSSLQSNALLPESAYRLSVSAENPLVANFRFEADQGRLARFLTYRNYMIEPACESENSYSTTHTRITMRRDGVAVLENGSWRVKTKALIRV